MVDGTYTEAVEQVMRLAYLHGAMVSELAAYVALARVPWALHYAAPTINLIHYPRRYAL